MCPTAYKIIAILLFLHIETVAAQVPVNPNRLPLCPRNYSDRYHNCWGNNTDTTFKYVGEFQNNQFNGFGSESRPWGNYIGYFQNSKPDGQGILTYNNGVIEIGEFRNNLLHGRGITYLSDGSINKQGIFEKSTLIRAENISLNFMYPIFNTVLPADRGLQNTTINIDIKKVPNSTTTFEVAKSKCEELGFKPETEGYGKCVLLLTK